MSEDREGDDEEPSACPPLTNRHSCASSLTPMRVLHLSYADAGGGAARAAHRLHVGLRALRRRLAPAGLPAGQRRPPQPQGDVLRRAAGPGRTGVAEAGDRSRLGRVKPTLPAGFEWFSDEPHRRGRRPRGRRGPVGAVVGRQPALDRRARRLGAVLPAPAARPAARLAAGRHGPADRRVPLRRRVRQVPRRLRGLPRAGLHPGERPVPPRVGATAPRAGARRLGPHDPRRPQPVDRRREPQQQPPEPVPRPGDPQRARHRPIRATGAGRGAAAAGRAGRRPGGPVRGRGDRRSPQGVRATAGPRWPR